jgi:glycosyltransferase involved in cell wall biosynthesis
MDSSGPDAVGLAGPNVLPNAEGSGINVPPGRAAQRVAVVVPAYNEQITIGSVVLEAEKYCDRVYVVNDGSKDLTSEIAKKAGAFVLEMEKNSGKAAALMKGLRRARDDGYTVVVMMDGDGQHKGSDIPALLAPVLENSIDMVIGSRFLQENKIPAYRQAGQKVLNKFTNMGSNEKLTDTQSGFRSLGPKALDNLDFESSGYSVESDMITYFTNKNLSIVEVPVAVRYDVPNGHKQGSASMGLGLLENVITTVAYKRPLLIFAVPGITLVLLGLILGMLSYFNFYIFSSWWLQLLLAELALALGLLMIAFGLMQNSMAMMLRMNQVKEKKG